MDPNVLERLAITSNFSGASLNFSSASLSTMPRFGRGHRLHKEDGPAAFYDDGTTAYYWHGTHVPSWVILNPEKINLKIILKEENIELRRVLIDRFGQGKFLKELGAEKKHEDDWGILWKVKRILLQKMFNQDDKEWSQKDSRLVSLNIELQRIFGTLQTLQFVQVKDGSSEKEYFLPVPSTLKRAKQAIAWTFKLKEEEYHPQIQT